MVIGAVWRPEKAGSLPALAMMQFRSSIFGDDGLRRRSHVELVAEVHFGRLLGFMIAAVEGGRGTDGEILAVTCKVAVAIFCANRPLVGYGFETAANGPAETMTARQTYSTKRAT